MPSAPALIVARFVDLQHAAREKAPIAMDLNVLSGDSSIRDVHYGAGLLSLIWDDFERGEDFQVQIRTDCLYYNRDANHNHVHWRLVPAATHLPVDPASERLIAPQDFGRQMSMARERLHLLLGDRASDRALLFQVRHSAVILACPVASSDAVRVAPLHDVGEG